MTYKLPTLKNKFLKGSLVLYGVVVLLDPTNSIFHLKTIVFALCLLCWLLFSNRNATHTYIGAILFSWLFLTYGMIISDIRIQPIDIGYKTQITNLYFLTLLILPLSNFSRDELMSLTFRFGLVLSVVIWILYLFYIYSGFEQAMYLYFTETANLTVMIAKRTTLGIEMPMFFYKTVPFMLLPLAYVIVYYQGLKRVLLITMFLFPIIIGGSRTPILCAALLIGISCYLKSSSYILKKVMLLIFGIAFIYVLLNVIIEAGNSNELKFDSYDSYYNSLTQDLSNFLLGKGIGSLVYIPTRGYMAYSELSIMDLYNQYGVIVGSLFFTFIMYPGLYLVKTKNTNMKILGWSYLLYMVISATNPLLFSSTGWFIWSIVTSISIKTNIIEFNVHKQNIIKRHDFSLPRCI